MADVKGIPESNEKYEGGFLQEVVRIGKGALRLLYRLNTDEITLDEFVEGLIKLNASDVLTKYWAYDEGDSYVLDLGRQILWLINSLERDCYYQFERYGITAFHEDFRELRDYLLALEKHCRIKI